MKKTRVCGQTTARGALGVDWFLILETNDSTGELFDELDVGWFGCGELLHDDTSESWSWAGLSVVATVCGALGELGMGRLHNVKRRHAGFSDGRLGCK
ncbi:unnamed protein product [Phytophthora fragariaefolia]|uniref:Unnamed protein product n=1 Tax=Phytophthora fragariaefolia TaxID=1490495 RepID=A0A9W6WWT7_9STRA|nr:unnamed protein product [Phytophthora fragariaefolia]